MKITLVCIFERRGSAFDIFIATELPQRNHEILLLILLLLVLCLRVILTVG